MQETAREASKAGAYRCRWAMVAVLLVAVFLRCAGLGPMEGMLTFDEAYNGADAMTLLHSPHLVPFLPGNHGRESGWVYLLSPFVAAFGARPFGLRLAAIMTGTLTVAGMYALAREILKGRAAVWAAAALGVLYWHVQMSHMALRANLFLLVGTLSLAILLRAHRTGRLRLWALGGVGTGLLVYTYFSAYPWLLVTLALVAWWLLREPASRRGATMALVLCLVALAPMAVYALLNPEQFLSRPSAVDTLSLQAIWQNLRLWAGAWLGRGDTFPEYNLPGRPALDAFLGVLAFLGMAGLAFAVRRRRQALLAAGLAVAGILPSLLSNQAPHFLRAFGLTLPLALILGAGAWALERALRRLARRFPAPAVPLALLALSGGLTYHDFTAGWLHDPQVFTRMEAHVNQAITILKRNTPASMPVYFSPFALDHPVLVFRRAELAPRPVRAFDSHQCLVVADEPAAYVSLTMFEPAFQEELSQWVDVRMLAQDEGPAGEGPRYTVLEATPRPGALHESEEGYVFGGAVQVRVLTPMPAEVRAGDTIPVTLGVRALEPLGQPYSVFVHLYGDPTPYEGGTMWGQGDCQLCPSYPTLLWQPDETVIQSFTLAVAEDAPAGRYTIAAGVYQAPGGPRSPVTVPGPQANDYVVLQHVEVVPE